MFSLRNVVAGPLNYSETMPMWYVSVIACLRLDNFSFFSFCCTDQTKKYVHKCGQRWRWKKTLTCDICHMLFCRAFSVRPTHICGIFMRPITILLPFFFYRCHAMKWEIREKNVTKWNEKCLLLRRMSADGCVKKRWKECFNINSTDRQLLCVERQFRRNLFFISQNVPAICFRLFVLFFM